MAVSRVVLLLVGCAIASASPIYTVVDLGGTSAYSVNDSGAVAGILLSNGQQTGFLGSQTGLQFYSSEPFGSESVASGINNSGQVAGTILGNGGTHGVVWTNGVMRDLGNGTSASGINDAGWIVGGDGQAFVSGTSGLQNLGVLPGGDWSTGAAINNQGAVTGYGDIGNGRFEAFLWLPGGALMPLGTLGGGDSYGTGINARNEVAGYGTARSGYTHAFAGTPGDLQDLGTLGGTSSYAYNINDSGAVVGASYVGNGGETHAFVYLNGVMVDLNTLIPSGSGWDLLEAFGINDRGQIAGEGRFDGQLRAFRLDPASLAATSRLTIETVVVPEPASLGLMGVGLLALAWLRRRSRAACSPRL